jgi:flagellar basal-body rod protein FlgF
MGVASFEAPRLGRTMENTTYIALSRQAALWRQMEVVANNMANANTPAYKGEQMMFREYLLPTRSSDRAFGGKLSFVQDIGIMRNTAEGPLVKTDNPLDIALHGDGYFQIETEAGMRYSRNGHFRLDETGMLVTSQGFAVMDTRDQPIIFAPNEKTIAISPDGTVTTETGRVAAIKVVRFANEQDLRKSGDGLYDTNQEAQIVERPNMVQGMMEESNVQPIAEMTRMISVLREYEHNQKMIEVEHDRTMKAMQILANVRQA